ncbi:pheromone-binding protein 1-like [Leguminivora glycinivorella]|uniref:pheromone-binding protein 1-like n=1 Tax=Leguminivora glycinivorella TaxID=1035111 RepID=UPI00200C3DB5|nr:pheromone-binding protein 1-like [Leguminivora glycinivorella]
MCSLKGTLLTVAVCLVFAKMGESSKEVLHKMSTHFKEALDDCKKELNSPESVQKDFDFFWQDDYVVTNRETGCAVMCLSHKLEIVDPDLNLQHGNAKDFALKHGADEALAQELVKIIHTCGEGAYDPDSCTMVLNWVNCFKAEIHKKGMAPPVDVIMGELVAEV